MLSRFFNFTSNRDLEFEIRKYDKKSQVELELINATGGSKTGLDAVPLKHIAPFIDYYDVVKAKIYPGSKVLELGAGSGIHTGILVSRGAEVTAIDISEVSLNVCTLRYGENVKTVCCDMRDLPFEASTFDFIVGCGILSYVDFDILLLQINKLLKPGGQIIFLDTLDGNPVYRLNRFLHYLKGQRSLSTLRRMPSTRTLEKFQNHFDDLQFKTYGSFLWLDNLLKIVKKDDSQVSLITKLDEKKYFARYAFKFLLTAKHNLNG